MLSGVRMSLNRIRSESVAFYELYVIHRDGQSRMPCKAKLKVVIHSGDHGEAVITVMLPTED